MIKETIRGVIGIFLILASVFLFSILSIIEWIASDPKYIKCSKCKTKNKRAKGWDYQKCKCGNYLYDMR